jgi:hypothetical protein
MMQLCHRAAVRLPARRATVNSAHPRFDEGLISPQRLSGIAMLSSREESLAGRLW